MLRKLFAEIRYSSFALQWQSVDTIGGSISEIFCRFEPKWKSFEIKPPLVTQLSNNLAGFFWINDSLFWYTVATAWTIFCTVHIIETHWQIYYIFLMWIMCTLYLSQISLEQHILHRILRLLEFTRLNIYVQSSLYSSDFISFSNQSMFLSKIKYEQKITQPWKQLVTFAFSHNI